MASGYRRIVVGVDGSPHSRRAVAFVARLVPPRGGRVTCVRVVEPVRLPSMPFVPAPMRAQIAAQAATMDRRRRARAQRQVDAATTKLAKAGWRARASCGAGSRCRSCWPRCAPSGPTFWWWGPGEPAR